VTALFFIFLVTMGLRAQKAKPVSGANALIGQTAITIGTLDPSGQVSVVGEIWRAVSLSGAIGPNEDVTIKEIKELTLYVEHEKA
jgi:membrane-bound serine protease (ClpP class)